MTIAEVYGQYLKAKGYDVSILTPAGFRTEAIDGLKNDDLDMIVDYIGGDQAALAPDAPPSADPATVSETISPLFADLGATLLDFSPATDGDAFVVRGDSTAETISDVKGLTTSSAPPRSASSARSATSGSPTRISTTSPSRARRPSSSALCWARR